MVHFPAYLRSGDRLVLVAPSSPFEPAELEAAVQRFQREGFRVEVAEDVLERDDYLAGSDTRRRTELQRALDDVEVRAIVAVRGGYGAGRIAAQLDARRFLESPKWIVGFSDVTVLHAWAQSIGVASVHGPNGGGVGRSEPEAQAVMAMLRGEATEATWQVRAASSFEPVSGVAAGGNLTVLAHEAIAGRLPSMSERVVFLEDVGERVYRVDRMLAALVDGRFFSGAKAIVLGHFTRCEGRVDGRTLDQLARELEARVGVPVVQGAPFGHEAPNEIFVQGARVRVTSTAVTHCFGTSPD